MPAYNTESLKEEKQSHEAQHFHSIAPIHQVNKKIRKLQNESVQGRNPSLTMVSKGTSTDPIALHIAYILLVWMPSRLFHLC